MLLRISFLLLMIVSAASCKKEKHENPIPYAPVNLTLYASDPEFFKLNVVGGWIYMQGGSRGLIIYRRGNEEFVTFDRHCTYNVTSTCGKVFADSSMYTLTDTCCGSVFQMYDGSVSKGPAEFPLKPYPTSFDGHVLTVRN